jgi:hypothetical protein
VTAPLGHRSILRLHRSPSVSSASMRTRSERSVRPRRHRPRLPRPPFHLWLRGRGGVSSAHGCVQAATALAALQFVCGCRLALLSCGAAVADVRVSCAAAAADAFAIRRRGGPGVRPTREDVACMRPRRGATILRDRERMPPPATWSHANATRVVASAMGAPSNANAWRAARCPARVHAPATARQQSPPPSPSGGREFRLPIRSRQIWLGAHAAAAARP